MTYPGDSLKPGDSAFIIRGYYAGQFATVTELKPGDGEYDVAVRFANGETNEYMSYCLVPHDMADEYREDLDQ